MDNGERRDERSSLDSLSCIDAHIHLDMYSEEEREAMLQEALGEGVKAVVAVSRHMESALVNYGLAQRYPQGVHPAYGFHPEQELPADDDIRQLIEWIRERHAAGEPFAIGEVGLPYYMRTEAEAVGQPFDEAPYIELLDRFVALAAELDRPIVLHAVYEDADKACGLLERHGVRKAHFHWFKGSEDSIRRMAASGYYVSVTPDVAYEEEIKSLVRQYPLTQLMTETDGPWPFEGPYAGKRTIPSMTKEVVADIAVLKGLQAQEAAEQLLRNTKQFYTL
ncbi:TatD family hydrolase [Paenibacillus sp. J5C_2022]|uniref:TatD family hydrolase n=1 Tax=Paenibacillus sp. J5C2022 TaxID=2977129 RepID=UPI0021CECB1A|nr:TatD family hydrolase [Paenibacillus sp. J5C2022]MCU6708915.1 TatD family hydrolase [Paenibacillus sp. J5C2022]